GATASDIYRVTISGASGGVTDVSGNLLDGDNNGIPGGDSTIDFVVFNPGASRTYFVGQAFSPNAPVGSRGNPYPTITAALAVAPLAGTSASGPINSSSAGVILSNSDVLFDRNYVVDSGAGVAVNYGGSSAVVPRFEDNVFVGNITGLLTNDTGTTAFKSGAGM